MAPQTPYGQAGTPLNQVAGTGNAPLGLYDRDALRPDPTRYNPWADPYAMSSGESKTRQKTIAGQLAVDPSLMGNMARRDIWSDPAVRQMWQGYSQQQQDWANMSGGLGTGMRQLEGAMTGEDSMVDASARAEAERARQGIAQQAMMGARGGMSPAAQRQAMMQQSQVGAQMASQVAAAKAQERQQATQNYLMARQQQIQNMKSGLGQALNIYGGGEDIGSARQENMFAAGDRRLGL